MNDAARKSPSAPRGGERQVPDKWRGSSALVNVRDAKLREKARSLVQSGASGADKAKAIYAFVRQLPFTADAKFRARSAREVLERGTRDAAEKATLLIGLLRAAGVPARLKFIAAPREALRGLPMDVGPTPRPYIEVWVDGRWVCTDTYIFDEGYLAAARERLRREREDSGYGILEGGATLWEPHRDAYLLGPDAVEEVGAQEHRAFHDPADYARSLPLVQRLGLWWRQARWNLGARRLDEAVRRIRSAARKVRRSSTPAPPARRRHRAAPAKAVAR